MLMEKEREQRKRNEKIDKEYKEYQNKKKELLRNQQEELFLLDLERERDSKNKTGNLAQRKMVIFIVFLTLYIIQREQEEIRSKLEAFDMKIKKNEELKTQEMN